ncbi:MAG: cob(I)yrinic acid a,c-diamide adenosyltransferase [Lachnospiraceae bacterium]|nr:cob(I)yrinic acid a,c-diamide adenosyltransferase [Lachnospiraceae bacterium]
MTEIYVGDGKGKSTAAAGLALRAVGRGLPVTYVQFLKDGTSGEISVMRGIPGIEVVIPDRFFGFVSGMSGSEKAEIRDSYDRVLKDLRKKHCVEDGADSVIIMDEVLHAVHYGLIDTEALLDLMDDVPSGTEIVLTGRDMPRLIEERADYITRFEKVRHPFDKGIRARKGIEY